MALNIGDKAPQFSLLDQIGNTVKLSDFKGKKVVLYFYPKDFTPGCTQEACDFRDAYQEFTQLNTVILGVSKDSVEKHSKFKEKLALPFTLLADSTGEACEAYGVMKQKSMFGKSFLAINRMTFLIDENSKIAHIWPKVSVPKHITEIVEFIKKT